MRYFVNREKKIVIASNSQSKNDLTKNGYQEISAAEYDMLNRQYTEEYNKNNPGRRNYLWQKSNS